MREEGGSASGASSRLRKAARKMILVAANACGSFSRKKALVDPIAFDHSNSASISGSRVVSPKKMRNIFEEDDEEEFESSSISNALPSAKNLCAICLDPLSYSGSGGCGSGGCGSSRGSSPGQAIFTAQCSHAFHFACIASNVRHGSVTCPICRAHWTQLPRNLNHNPAPSSCSASADPILRILDDSIANFRIHRRSFLRSARYDDDDPIEPDADVDSNETSPRPHPRLHLSLIPIQPYPHYHQNPHHYVTHETPSNKAYLSIKLANQRAMDLVLVASPNGPHLRLLKQCMALVVFSLRPIDRLAIVTYSSAAARVFPLRRMTSYGQRTALQVIDRLFYMGQADPVEGLKKGIKILQDRAHRNPESGILHLSDSPTQTYHAAVLDVPIAVHRFHVGFGFGTSNGLIMHEFEEFLGGLLGGSAVRDVQLRVRAGEELANGRVVRIGELRGGEERRVLLDLGEGGAHACVEYSYTEEVGEDEERFVAGESLVSVGDGKSSSSSSSSTGGVDVATAAAGIGGGGGGGGGRRDVVIGGGRPSSVEGWDYHDPYMARRWAKHLHGYRL